MVLDTASATIHGLGKKKRTGTEVAGAGERMCERERERQRQRGGIQGEEIGKGRG